jgi:hypothetical protein
MVRGMDYTSIQELELFIESVTARDTSPRRMH